jgi:hypothetical protein
MKTKELQNILNKFKFIFNNNNYIEESNYIFFDCTKNSIFCYSQLFFIKYKYNEGSLKEDFGLIDSFIAIEAKPFFNLINKIKKEEISIKQKENSIEIKNGRSSTNFSLMQITPNEAIINLKEYHANNTLPENINFIFKKYALYDKTDKSAENIIFENKSIICTDSLNFVKAEIDCEEEFIIRWDALKYVLDNNLLNYHVDKDYLTFTNENTTFICKHPLNKFEYEKYFNLVEENIGDSNSYFIYPNKEEDISYLDTILSGYAKLDREIQINVKSKRMLLIAINHDKTGETRINIPIDKYKSGENEIFDINVDFFKEIYNNYDYMVVMDSMLYCNNVEDMVERITVIRNKER